MTAEKFVRWWPPVGLVMMALLGWGVGTASTPVDDLFQRATHDDLTGVANRRGVMEVLQRSKAQADRSGQPLCVALLDVDHFKRINDEHGHATGDEVLRQIGRALREASREVDTVARMGGDEFTVILAELPSSSHLEGILQKMLRALGDVFQLGTEQVFVSASIGITMLVSWPMRTPSARVRLWGLAEGGAW